MAGARPRRTVSTSGSSGMVNSGFRRFTHSAAAGAARAMVLPAKDYSDGREGAKRPISATKTVPLADKQGLVDDVFHSVARRYDLMNDLMSGGLHRAWKDALVTAVNPPQVGQALRVARSRRRHRRRRLPRGRSRRRRHAGHRLRHQRRDAGGRPRARRRSAGIDDAVTFEQGNAEELPYPDRSFDCVTIAFGIRNVPRIERALAEAYRVLRIGGRFLCLEFSARRRARASTRSTSSIPSTSSRASAPR